MLFCPEISQLALYSACISDVRAPSMINGIKGFACRGTPEHRGRGSGKGHAGLDSCQACRSNICSELAKFALPSVADYVACQLAGLADYDPQVILSAKLRPAPRAECVNNPRLKNFQHLDYIPVGLDNLSDI